MLSLYTNTISARIITLLVMILALLCSLPTYATGRGKPYHRIQHVQQRGNGNIGIVNGSVRIDRQAQGHSRVDSPPVTQSVQPDMSTANIVDHQSQQAQVFVPCTCASQNCVQRYENYVNRVRNIIVSARYSIGNLKSTAIKSQLEEFLNAYSKRIFEMEGIISQNEFGGDIFQQTMAFYIDTNRQLIESQSQALQSISVEDALDRNKVDLVLNKFQPVHDDPFRYTLDDLKQKVLDNELLHALSIIPIPRIDNAPTCFISYAWGQGGHESQVHRLAQYLSNAGIDVHIDIHHNQWGSIGAYINHINTDNYIVVVGTPALRSKWDSFVSNHSGGNVVGQEMNMIQERMRRDGGDNVLVKILLDGNSRDEGDSIKGSFPPFIGGCTSAGANFTRGGVYYYKELFEVIKKLYEHEPEILRLIDENSRVFIDRIIAINNADSEESIQQMINTWQR